ncbi:uncharacterized protein B0I36DRAFT_352999 [Microdochium trichocladiopsis]|uniref:Uncharacterized protein n=1 Tax=Microdochium trichocladiopsis TaxID=1682393 RepID=A0A9P9BJ12_9PEZI|nr:uncharacterized protein B0I36DRAFT_352999 [Microdochium trichocladiopsis]KAH7024803.1 hypothetical protein B0I36DRAFT_352999 [Microdochium trichocladiopsis]
MHVRFVLAMTLWLCATDLLQVQTPGRYNTSTKSGLDACAHRSRDAAEISNSLLSNLKPEANCLIQTLCEATQVPAGLVPRNSDVLHANFGQLDRGSKWNL